MKKNDNKTTPSNATIIAFANHKGGVAKTTTTLSVGYGLARRGYKVLLLDLDPQSNLTFSLVKEDADYESVYDALSSGSNTLPVITINKTLDLVPSSLNLTQLEITLTGRLEREYIISDKLREMQKNYDFILIDCPPSMGIFTINALVAADYVIIPMTPEVIPYKGLGSLVTLVAQISERLNQRLSVLGIVFTKYKAKLNLTTKIESAVRQVYGPLLLDSHIRDTVKVAEAPLGRASIMEYAPKSSASLDYESLVEEILGRLESASETSIK